MYQDGFFVISMLPITPTARRPRRTRTDTFSFQDYLLNDIAATVLFNWLGWLDSNQRQHRAWPGQSRQRSTTSPHPNMVHPQRVELCVPAYKAGPQDRRGQGAYK